MNKSESVAQLYAALSKAQGAFATINKANTATVPTKAGGSYSYDFADWSDVVEAVRPILAAHGLGFTQWPVVNAHGNEALETMIFHESGEWMSATMLLHGAENGAQAQGSAITYAKRYALCAALGIATDKDDDGQAAQQNHRPSAQQKVNPETGEIEVPPEVEDIIKAAKLEPSNEFLTSLADQWERKGSLSPKQLESGAKSARRVLMENSATEGPPEGTETFDYSEEPF